MISRAHTWFGGGARACSSRWTYLISSTQDAFSFTFALGNQDSSLKWMALCQDGGPYNPCSLRVNHIRVSRAYFMTGIVQIALDTSAQFNPKQNQALLSRGF